MKIRAIFIAADGRAYSQLVPANRRAIEFADGCHPFVPEAVFYDRIGKGPPLIIYWQDRLLPEGCSVDFATLREWRKEMFHVGQHRQKYPLSRRWARSFARGFVLTLKIVMMAMLAVIAVLIARGLA